MHPRMQQCCRLLGLGLGSALEAWALRRQELPMHSLLARTRPGCTYHEISQQAPRGFALLCVSHYWREPWAKVSNLAVSMQARDVCLVLDKLLRALKAALSAGHVGRFSGVKVGMFMPVYAHLQRQVPFLSCQACTSPGHQQPGAKGAKRRFPGLQQLVLLGCL